MESNGGGRVRPFSGIAFRLWLAIVAIVVVITAFVTVLSLQLTRQFLVRELRDRVLNIAELGARTIDQAAFARLVARLSPGLAKDEISAVEQSADYKRISDELNAVRNVQKGLILYAYTLAPEGEEGKARFVVDADVLDLVAQGAAEADISHFDQAYDIADFPEMKVAFDGKPSVESSFTYDETYKVSSFSGYVPIFAPGGDKAIAILGLDVSAGEVNAYFGEFRSIFIIFLVAIVLLTVVAALFIARGLTRSLATFLTLFARATEGDLTARYPLRRAHDEISRTAVGFNHFMEILHGSIADVLTSSLALDDRARAITDTSHELAASAAEQAASIGNTQRVLEGFMRVTVEIRRSVGYQVESLKETIATLDHLSEGIKQVASHARYAQEKVAENVRAAEGGREKIDRAVAGIAEMSKGMEEVVREIEAVDEKSENIDRIVQVIGEISDRTSILAINAAIEAARLGAEGSGFKVVADEIKKIAEATAGYAEEIKAIVGSIKQGIVDASAITRRGLSGFLHSRSLAEETSRDLGAVVGDIQAIDSLVREIDATAEKQGMDAAQITHQSRGLHDSFADLTAGMESQDQGTQAIMEGMKELAQVADSNATVASQLTELATLLGERSNELSRIVSQYKLVVGPMEAPTPQGASAV